MRQHRHNKAKARLWLVGQNLKVIIRHNYKNISKLGSDRLVNIYGAAHLYRPPLLILDYGTALTCDYISKEGVFKGGLIIPGPAIALEALSEKAVLLPDIPFPKRANSLTGKDTRSGMEAGILHGFGALTDGLIEKFRHEYGSGFKVIATGGLAARIRPYTAKPIVLDPNLTLKSLVEIFHNVKPY